VATLGRWYAFPEQIVVSNFATICSRLRRFAYSQAKRGSWHVNKHLVSQVALYYAVTHNHYFFDRCLALIRYGSWALLRSMISWRVSTLDVTLRFVYDQTWQQVLWSNTRSAKTRDQSISDESASFLSQNLCGYQTRSNQYVFNDGSPYKRCIPRIG
jgi:hypothetical protein